jgi:hypothetical protein
MAITPSDIEHMTFSEDKDHGYNTDEVDAFLDQLSVEVDAMLKKIADLKGRLTSTEQQLASAQAQVAQLQDATGSTATSSDTASVQQMAASERQISQVLIVAQQSADKIVADARQSADDIRNEADQKAREVIRQALAEKQTELDEIERLKDSQDSFREAYKKMLQHFMDDADAVLPGKKGEQVDVSVLENKANGSFAASASQDGVHAAASDAALSDFSDLD